MCRYLLKNENKLFKFISNDSMNNLLLFDNIYTSLKLYMEIIIRLT